MTDPTVTKQSRLQAEFRKLGAFARSGLAADNHRLAIGQDIEDFLAVVEDRQFRIVIDPIRSREPLIKACIGGIECRLPSLQILIKSFGADPLKPCPLPGQSGRIMTQQTPSVDGSLGVQAHVRSQRIANILAATIKQKPHRVSTPSSSSISGNWRSRQKILLYPSKAQALKVSMPARCIDSLIR